MSDWSRIMTSAPVNRAAALARSGRGEAPVERVDPSNVISRTPLPTRPVQAGSLDLTGAVFGRLIVIGQADRAALKLSDRCGRWVCRCKCGLYQAFTAKGLRSMAERAMCQACENARRLREGYDTSGAVPLPKEVEL